MEEVNEFAVCIIQSLGTGERQTGQNLYDDVLRLKNIQEEELTVEITNVATREEFFSALSNIEDKIVNDQWHVILHAKKQINDRVYLVHYSFCGKQIFALKRNE